MLSAGTLLRACGVRVCSQSPAMRRWWCRVWLCSAFLAGAFRTTAADIDAASYARVLVAPAKTSIYLGSVSMAMGEFVRVPGGYEAPYVAKVFPFFFYDEAGQLRVEISEAGLRQLAAGEPVEFRGRAVRADGAERRVEGKATPADAASGKIKVRVFYSKRIELIFNTTYRFLDAPRSTASTGPALAEGRSER
jgi:hypothetical protein